MKYKDQPWPSDGITRKAFDKKMDRIHRRLDRLRKAQAEYFLKTKLLEEFMERGPHAAAYALFIENKRFEDQQLK